MIYDIKGGNDPNELGDAVALTQGFGRYHEINLNCGCPSNKAKRGGFGVISHKTAV